MEQVVFNALQTSLSGGIGRYSYELANGMYKLNKIDLKIVIREEDRELFDFVKEEDLVVAEGIKNSRSRNYYEQFKLPKLIHRLYPKAIIHYPDSMAPLFSKNKVVITIHDLAFKSLKNAFTWKTSLWKNSMTKLSVKKAYRIIGITNFAKCEILKYYNVQPDNIGVVYNGFNDFSKEPIILENVSSDILSISNKSYILTVSTISPRKNIDGLIKAFDLIKDQTDCNLIVAGKNGWMYENVFKLVDELKLENRVMFTGAINDDELKLLYKNTKLFVYPSFYEGFGLPPLEAMSFGIPCAVSNSASIPEVVEDAALKFDPKSIKDMSDCIIKLLGDSNIKDELLCKSKNIVNSYSWDKCAYETMKLYMD